MGYEPVAKHRTKKITLYRQGEVTYLVNEELGSHAVNFAGQHGPCASGMGFNVVNAEQAYQRALSLGAEPADPDAGSYSLDVPAIKGIGGSLLYFVDRYGAKGSAFDIEYEWVGEPDPTPESVGLFYLDHLTHNVGVSPQLPRRGYPASGLRLPRHLRHGRRASPPRIEFHAVATWQILRSG